MIINREKANNAKLALADCWTISIAIHVFDQSYKNGNSSPQNSTTSITQPCTRQWCFNQQEAWSKADKTMAVKEIRQSKTT